MRFYAFGIDRRYWERFETLALHSHHSNLKYFQLLRRGSWLGIFPMVPVLNRMDMYCADSDCRGSAA